MIPKTCGTCDFFSALAQECKCNPPSVTIVPGPNGQPVRLSAWPSVKPEQWCGQHQSEPKIATA